ncbi:MAG: ATP synthase subunit C [Candidatus Hodarchaeota archaeon]
MKIKNWMKFVLFLWCVTLLVLMITLAVHGQEEPTELTNQGDLAIGAGIAIGLAGLGAGLGMGNASSSAIGSITEKPEVFGKSMIFIVMMEAIAIYGLVIAILLFGLIG